MPLLARLSELYAILDAQAVEARALDLLATAWSLRKAGVSLLQYRDKSRDIEAILRRAQQIREVFSNTETVLILNDYAELVQACGFHGVHLGQNDRLPKDAKDIVGSGALIGKSTHTLAQACAANDDDSVDYLAIGPIFSTTTKQDSEPIVGLEGLRAVRGRVSKPLVAIGGISESTIAAAIAGGADSVAVISALFSDTRSVEEQARRLAAQSRWASTSGVEGY